MAAPHMHGCSLVNVRYCLQTHPHADHMDLSHLLSRSPEYGVVGAPVLNIYASRETVERAAQTFYGTDTATLFEQTWQAFHDHRMQFDVVILDHIYGPGQAGSDHLSVATHIAHEGNAPHPDLNVFAREHGYEVAYDGLALTI